MFKLYRYWILQKNVRKIIDTTKSKRLHFQNKFAKLFLPTGKNAWVYFGQSQMKASLKGSNYGAKFRYIGLGPAPFRHVYDDAGVRSRRYADSYR